jgi:hypothetical protein
MARKVYVTGAQKDAAQMLVERGAANGKPASDAVKKIANAKSEPGVSARNVTSSRGEVRRSGQSGGFRQSTNRPVPEAT